MSELALRTITVSGAALTVISLPDRRQGEDGERKDWMLQSELENYLYGNHTTKGSLFRLLARSGADGQSMCLRRRQVDEGLVTDVEYIRMRDLIHPGVRAFTIVPMDAIEMALHQFGRTMRAFRLAEALDVDPWDEDPWDEGEEAGGEEAAVELGQEGEDAVEGEGQQQQQEEEVEEEVEEEEEEEEQQQEEEADDSSDGGGDTDGGGGGASSKGTSGDHTSGSGGSESGEYAPTDEEDGPPADVDAASNASSRGRASSTYALEEIPDALDAELSALAVWRLSPINRDRQGVAVAKISCDQERKNILRLLGWFVSTKKLTTTPTLGVFHSPKIGAAVQRFAEMLVAEKQRKYSTVSKYIGSFLSAARFVHARRMAALPAGAKVDSTAVDQLAALHTQSLQQARQQAVFDLAKPPTNWMDWSEIQHIRCNAESALASMGEQASVTQWQKVARDVALLMCLTHQPPDRVGVLRLLKLGDDGTLKRDDRGGFLLDLSSPGAHKTSATFGPSTTTVPPAIARCLSTHLGLSAVPEGGYIFAQAGDPFAPMEPNQWTAMVKATFKRYGGVALAPKDLRSSFVTFLKTGEHSNETLRAAATAMRHSSKTQGSAAYHKGQSDRLVQAAVDAAATFAARFTPAVVKVA